MDKRNMSSVHDQNSDPSAKELFQPKYHLRPELFYPHSQTGHPITVSPTDYGLNYKISALEKVKSRFLRIWFRVRKNIRKRTVWLKELGKIYQDGFYRSTIPSADVLANPRREPLRKLLWCIVLTPLIFFTISDLTDVIQGYMQYPVIYTYEYKTRDTLEFPDVTICNVNPFMRSKACANGSLLFEAKRFKKEGEELVILPFCRDNTTKWMCERLCGKNEVVKQPNKEDTLIRTELARWIKETTALGKEADTEIMHLGHRVSRMVKQCSYASNDDCSTNYNRFTETMSQLYGSCFCFHCGNKSQHLEILSEEEKLIAKKEQEEWDKYYEYGTLSSPLSGLVIQLNTEVEEYLPVSNEVGFVALIHEHNKDYSICQDAIYILPGYTTYIGLNLATTQNLEPPYEDGCRREWPIELKEGSYAASVKVMDPVVETQQYSRAMCLEYCQIEYLIYKCKCIENDPAVKIHPDLSEYYKYCKSPRKEKCVEDALANKTNIDWQARCDCRRECETQRYAMDVSVAGFVSDEHDDSAAENITAHLYEDMSVARMVVYFHSFTYEHVKAIKKYDEIRVLSNIGGINGMYLGLSFYLLFQALDIIVVGAMHFVKKLQSKKLLFGNDGNLMSSMATQTSARVGTRLRHSGKVNPEHIESSESNLSYSRKAGKKSLWEMLEKIPEQNDYNTSERFNTNFGPFVIHYDK